MRSPQCLFNSAVALRKVFVSNAVAWEASGHLQRLLLPSLIVPSQPSPSSSPARRPFSAQRVAKSRNGRSKPGSGNATTVNYRETRNYDIAFPWIQLRQADGTLTEPRRTNQVLKGLDLQRETLVLLAAPRANDLSKGPQYPVCRIADRQAEVAAQAEKEAAKKKEPKVVSKEMELNWAIAPHDLRTKMVQLKKFLSKGYQVKVTMMNLKKRSKRRASLEEGKEALKAVGAAMAEVPGAKETRAMEGEVGDTVILHLQGPTGGAAPACTESLEGVTSTDSPAATAEPAAEHAAVKPAVSGG